MEHQTRHEVEGKSFSVEETSKGLVVTHSTWVVGYTPAHKATKREALEYYTRKQHELADEHFSKALDAVIMLKELEIEEGLR